MALEVAQCDMRYAKVLTRYAKVLTRYAKVPKRYAKVLYAKVLACFALSLGTRPLAALT